MADLYESALEVEVESLEAIYINELSCVRKPDGTVDSVELLLHPSTGDDVTKQFVCMTLVFRPGHKYPDEIPVIEIKNPRGLGEEEVACLIEDMTSKAKECIGEVMLYTLIQMAKDSLTEGNIPHCPCVVCLEHFDENDHFHRTSCYHYFHKQCLSRYLHHCSQQKKEEKDDALERRHMDPVEEKVTMCPLCRAPLDETSLSVVCHAEELESKEQEKESSFVLSDEHKQMQQKMKEMFERQKEKGGIIDLEQERNKFLINEEDRAATTNQTISITVNPDSVLNSSHSSNDMSHGNYSEHDQHRGGKPNGGDSFKGRTLSCRGRGKRHNEDRQRRPNQNRRHHDSGGSSNSGAEGVRPRYPRHYDNHTGGRHYDNTIKQNEDDKQYNSYHHNDHHSHDRNHYTDVRSFDNGGKHPNHNKSSPEGLHCKDGDDQLSINRNTDKSETECSERPASGFNSRGGYSKRGFHTQHRSKNDFSHRHGRQSEFEREHFEEGLNCKDGDDQPSINRNTDKSETECSERPASCFNSRPTSGFYSRGGYSKRGFHTQQRSKNDFSHRQGRETFDEDKGKEPLSRSGEHREYKDQRGNGKHSFRGHNHSMSNRYTYANKQSSQVTDQESHNSEDTNFGKDGDRLISGKTETVESTNQRGKGRGRFRDMDAAYFKSLDRSDNDDLNRNGERKDSTIKKASGCRDGQRQAYSRDDEYDDERGGHHQRTSDSGNGRNRGRRQGWRGGSNSGKCDRGSHVRQGNKTANVDNDYVDSYYGEQLDKKIVNEMELNRKWRKLNYGIDVNSDRHKKQNFTEAKPRQNDYNEANFNKTSSVHETEEIHEPVSNQYYTSDVNTFYVGHDDVDEEEEDWEAERFPYAFERNFIRTEDLKEYDKFRRQEYVDRWNSTKEKADRERLMREEDRRMRREQAETARKLDNAVTAVPAKSVLDMFKEKQEAKKREAERLQQEQGKKTLEKEDVNKKEKEVINVASLDAGVYSDESRSQSSSASSDDMALSSSSQGYQSQLSNEDSVTWQQKEDGDDMQSGIKPRLEVDADSSSKKKESIAYNLNGEILWVGVKNKPDPGDVLPTVVTDEKAMRSGLDDPCADAWDRREQRKKGRQKKKKGLPNEKYGCINRDKVSDMKGQNEDYCSPHSNDASEIETKSFHNTSYQGLSQPTQSNMSESTGKTCEPQGAKPKLFAKAPPSILKLSKKKNPKPQKSEQPTALTMKEFSQLKELCNQDNQSSVEELTNARDVPRLNDLQFVSNPVDTRLNYNNDYCLHLSKIANTALCGPSIPPGMQPIVHTPLDHQSLLENVTTDVQSLSLSCLNNNFADLSILNNMTECPSLSTVKNLQDTNGVKNKRKPLPDCFKKSLKKVPPLKLNNGKGQASANIVDNSSAATDNEAKSRLPKSVPNVMRHLSNNKQT